MADSVTAPSAPANAIGQQRAVGDAGGAGRAARLQRIVDRAAETFDTPIAAITIIDQDRKVFAVRHGFDIEETPRAHSFCSYAIQRPGEALVVLDAARDARFAQNRLVAQSPHLRFYAGVPLIDRSGYAIGALCIMDPRPHAHIPDLVELGVLAREVERLIAR